MSKAKKQIRRRTTPVTKRAKVLTALIGTLLLSALVVMGQQMANNKRFKDSPADERIEFVVKMKDPKFELTNKIKRKNAEENYILQGWRLGDETASVSLYEQTSEEEAIEVLRSYVNAPVSVPKQTTQLTNLGDEAYISVGNVYNKKAPTSLFFRSGNVVVVMSASSPAIAKRLAKHMTNAIGKKDESGKK